MYSSKLKEKFKLKSMISKDSNTSQNKTYEISIDPILTFNSIIRERKFLFKLTSLLSFITLIIVISKKPYFKSSLSFESSNLKEYSLFKKYLEEELSKFKSIKNYNYPNPIFSFNSNNKSINIVTNSNTEELANENTEFMKNLFTIFTKNRHEEKQKIVSELRSLSKDNLISTKDKIINFYSKGNDISYIIDKNYVDSIRQKFLFNYIQNINFELLNKKENFDEQELNKYDYSELNKNVMKYNEDMLNFDLFLLEYLRLESEYLNNIFNFQKRNFKIKYSKHEVEKIHPKRVNVFLKYSFLSLILSSCLAFVKDRKYLFFKNKKN
tara:strand:+ start:17809 stop:18783 length:975 start_codon:yes stop_codon:yes gene_type:complete